MMMPSTYPKEEQLFTEHIYCGQAFPKIQDGGILRLAGWMPPNW